MHRTGYSPYDAVVIHKKPVSFSLNHDLYGFFDGTKEITILGSDWLSGPHSSASLARHHRRRHAAARRERSRESWQSSVTGSELRAAPRWQDLSQTKSFHVQHLDRP